MEEGRTRRERRRRRAIKQMEGKEFENAVENVEFSIQPYAAQSSRKLLRRDTYTVQKSRSDLDVAASEDFDEDLRTMSIEGNDSGESRNFTYSLKNSEDSRNGTYNVDKPEDPGGTRPVPAPRRRKIIPTETEKVSSDTDKDITEIDLDDIRLKSETNSKQSPNSMKSSDRTDLVVAPVPKPRKLLGDSQATDSNSQKPSKSQTSINSQGDKEKSEKSEKDGQSDEKPPEKSNELPLISGLQNETKSVEKEKSGKKERKSLSDLLDRRGRLKKPKMLSSMMKLEKRKIPKIASILKELKEEDEEAKQEVQDAEERLDFQIDSPQYPESAQNGRIYVQGKNGFYLMERDEVLNNGNGKADGDYNGGRRMEQSTVKTAVLFQKYWSRSMIYFHGILAGFAFSHAATVTAIMVHYNYEPKGFITVYSCLSLKIHYIFYTLTALCIVSCFDRIDVGHMNRKHWQTAWKIPSMWIILSVYLISFGLTFANQKTEARFDAYLQGNATEETIWENQTESDIQMSLLTWFHTVWARDMFVLFGWLVISLTKFSDFLFGHLSNMGKYAESKIEEGNLRRISMHSNYP